MTSGVFPRVACFFALFCVTVSALGQDPGRPIRSIGEFSDARYTEEHAYGFSVQLWRDGDSAIGFLLVSEGLQGDTPTGLLENVKFKPRTGALSFTARLTTGAVILTGGGQQPSQDLFTFSGALSARALTGTIVRSDARQPSRPGTRQRIELRLLPRSSMLPAGSWAEWKRNADDILKFRGPKW
jgi:hypothetical protein